MKIANTEALMSASRKLINAVDACDAEVGEGAYESQHNTAQQAYEEFKSTFQRIEKEITE